MQITCHQCHHQWTVEEIPGRRDECPQCQWDVRVCLNCQFYSPTAYRECSETQAEWVKEKTQGNFCGYFKPAAQRDKPLAPDNSRGALDQLFKDGGAEKDNRPKSLDDLFKK